MQVKKCAKCLESKPFSDYWKSKKGRFGLHNYCKPCGNLASREQRAKDPEKKRAQDREYLAANKEKIKAQREERFRKDPERYLSVSREYRQNNKEKLKEGFAQWYAKNGSARLKVLSEDRKNNPEKWSAIDKKSNESPARKKWIRENRPEIRAMARKSYHNNRDARLAYGAEYRVNSAEKVNARHELNRAIKSGLITRQPCKICGDTENIHGHHTDYSNPLDVIFLCPIHHAAVHRTQDRLTANL